MIWFLPVFLSFFSLTYFILFAYSLTRKRNQLAVLFACACLAASIYISGYALELHSENLKQIQFALRVEYFGAPFISSFWLLLSYKFLMKRSAPLLLAIPVIALPFNTLFLSVTNDYHHLIYTGISALEQGGYYLAQLEKGPWYYINSGFTYFVVLFSIAVFFRAWHNKGYQFRSQAFWILFGSVWPGVTNVIYLAGLAPFNMDLTPLGLSLSCICFIIAIFRYGFLELQENVKDVTFLGIGEGILVIDDKNRLIDFNQACKDIFGWLDLSQIGVPIGNFPEGKKILNQTGQNFELKIVKKGEEKHYEFRRTPLLDQNTRLGSVYFIHDVSRQKEMIRNLNDAASYDPLTEVYNRHRLMEEMKNELLRMRRYGSCLSILLIDVDHFEQINEQYGRHVGDEILKTLANACRDRLRRTDIVGRYGGETFLAILPEANEESALYVAESIRKCVAVLDFLSNGYVIHITVSIGVKTAFNHEEDLGIEAILSCANSALFHAKSSGRNRASSIAD